MSESFILQIIYSFVDGFRYYFKRFQMHVRTLTSFRINSDVMRWKINEPLHQKTSHIMNAQRCNYKILLWIHARVLHAQVIFTIYGEMMYPMKKIRINK